MTLPLVGGAELLELEPLPRRSLLPELAELELEELLLEELLEPLPRRSELLEDPEPLGLEPLDLEPLGPELLGLEPLGLEPLERLPLDLEPLDLEPLDLEPELPPRRPELAAAGRPGAALSTLSGAGAEVPTADPSTGARASRRLGIK